MIRRPPRSTLSSSSAASDVYKRQVVEGETEPASSVSLTPTSKRFIATFADEGAALHARALLSGRVIGTLGNIRALSARDGDVVTQDPRETKHNQKTVHMCLTRR
eukprot:TRINITY_DN19723_c0_g1_i1.p1 TRINITY_DN19723_c0_g1~~TRINITY_DN19723_c0_g1_i1.p1  ORF type:complete len:105 (-),score=30.92 TRINITY_DN19723_c0_g1_i1:332-646(-)